jgi:hypothetical protein
MERCTWSNPPRHLSKAGAVCGKAARTDLCGGRFEVAGPLLRGSVRCDNLNRLCPKEGPSAAVGTIIADRPGLWCVARWLALLVQFCGSQYCATISLSSGHEYLTIRQ